MSSFSSPPFFHAVIDSLRKFTHHADRDMKERLADKINREFDTIEMKVKTGYEC